LRIVKFLMHVARKERNVCSNIYIYIYIYILYIYIQQDAHVTEFILFYLTAALHVSGVTITHLQDHKTTVTTGSGNHYTILLPAAIVEELELV